MNRTLVKSFIVSENPDLRKQKYLSVFDGTGQIQPKGSAAMEVDINGKLFYVPYVGQIFKAQFPEIDISENGEIKDHIVIDKIKSKIF